MDIIFEKFEKDKDLSKQRELFVECFPENIGTPVTSKDHYLWKFHSISNPIGSIEFIAKMGNDIIGYYAAIPYTYVAFGKKITVAMVCDVMVGTKARGKGIFTKLGLYSINEFKKHDLAFATGYPIRAEVIPGHKKAGWDIPFEIPMYGKFLSTNSFLSSKNVSFLRLPANIIVKLYNSISCLVNYKSKPNLMVERYSQKQLLDIHGIEIYFENWNKEQSIHLLKNLDFMNWRLSAPKKEYFIIVLRRNSEIIGYTILREVTKESVPCIGILDFSFLMKYENLSSILFREIERVGKERKAELILMMMMKKQAKRYQVLKNGFIKTPFKFSFIIYQFDKSINRLELLKEDNWCLMWIDSDDL